jgi:hypothetical protein
VNKYVARRLTWSGSFEGVLDVWQARRRWIFVETGALVTDEGAPRLALLAPLE